MTRPLVIAHRGASGYLPEHTAEAKVLAHAMGADFIEQDIVASRDGVLLVLHDIYLEEVTDVALRYPGRARADGRFYAVDFDYSEIAALNVHERTSAPAAASTAPGTQLWPQRFPADRGRFKVSTFDEELELIAGLNRSTGRNAGIYPEIKAPAWHMEHGIDLSHLVLTALANHGYFEPDDPDAGPRVFLQCFDSAELQAIRRDVDPPIPLVQLLTGDDDSSAAALETIANYAQGIGPAWPMLLEDFNGASNGKPIVNDVCATAHELGLVVHPYTFRREQLPPFAADFAALIGLFARDVGIDGLFTDFPDLTLAVLEALDLN